ncbi:hypothetical protein [Enterococcus sp. LJL90]
MIRLKNEPIVTVSRLLKVYGFSCQRSEPTDEDGEQFIEAMLLTGRSDLPFTPLVNVVYERLISKSRNRYEIVEGYKEKNRMFYDFYQADFPKKDGEASRVIMFANHLNGYDMVKQLQRHFERVNVKNKGGTYD